MLFASAHRRAAVLAGFVFAAASVAGAQSTPYSINKAHSEADFSIRHMGISNVHGQFKTITGTVNYDPSNPAQSSVDATIDVTTVDTGVEMRDKHLRSPDFFDTAKFPTMTFKSTSVKKDGDQLEVDGDLTLHGITKPVKLMVDVSKEQIGMDGKSHARGFEATTTINRKDFGLNWNGTLKSGDSVLGDDVKIDISIEGDR